MPNRLSSLATLCALAVMARHVVAQPAPPEERRFPDALSAELARAPVASLVPFLGSNDANERRIAVRALGRVGGDEAATLAATLLRDGDPRVRVEACFAVGVTGSSRAAGLLEAWGWPSAEISVAGPTGEELAAAIAGLANATDDAAGALLVRFASRDDLPVEAPEALFRHARWRGRPWPGGVPGDLDKLLRYEHHASARGRAGVGWLGRTWKDPRLLPALERLAKDPEAEVRRAVALGLADGKDKEVRPAADADRALAVLTAFAGDADPRVAVAACRALASYDRGEVGVVLAGTGLAHGSFHVRTAAAEGLGALGGRKPAVGLTVVGAATAPDALEKLARGDPSTSVRYAAGAALRAIAPERARALVTELLASPSGFVRAGACETLATGEDEACVSKLVELAQRDPCVRVRESALEGLKGKKVAEAAARAAVTTAIAGDDPVLVSVAADVAATNGWVELAPALRAAFAKHGGTPGSDAREGVITALAKLAVPEDQALVRKTAEDDPDAGPRTAARAALAEAAKGPAPSYDRRPRPEGAVLPLGAKLLGGPTTLVLETSVGTMRIELDHEHAPLHAAHLADLARKGFYDGLTWHRVVPDFVIQGGCPRGDGAGNAGVTLPLEPTRTPFERGTLGMPRSSHPDTGGCQLFICHSRAPHLDVQYAAIGRVVTGLEVIDKIDVESKIVKAWVEEGR